MSRRSIVTAAFLLLALPAIPLLAADSGQEVRINTHTQGQQYFPAVAMDRHGNAVVVWQGDGPAGLGLYGRLFDRTGLPRGDQFLVAKASYPELAWNESVALDESGFVVAWSEIRESSQSRRLYSREMKLDGTPAGRPFELAQSSYGRIALGPDGRFLLVSVDSNGVYAQLRERSGEPAGDRVTLGNPCILWSPAMAPRVTSWPGWSRAGCRPGSWTRPASRRASRSSWPTGRRTSAGPLWPRRRTAASW